MNEINEIFYLYVNTNGEGAILKKDSRDKVYVVSSENRRLRYYQKVNISFTQCFSVYTNDIETARDRYPEYFI